MGFAAAQTMWMPMHPGLGGSPRHRGDMGDMGPGLNMGAAPHSLTRLGVDGATPAPPPLPRSPSQRQQQSPRPSWSTSSSFLIRQQLDSPRPWSPDHHSFDEAPCEAGVVRTTPSNKIKQVPGVRRQLSYQLPRWNGFETFQLEPPSNPTFLESARNSSVVHLSAGTTFFFSARSSIVSDVPMNPLSPLTLHDDIKSDIDSPEYDLFHPDDGPSRHLHDQFDQPYPSHDNLDSDRDSGSEYSSVVDLDLDIDPDLINLISFEESSMTASPRGDRHMAVSVRPKTARDYQRYRSQWSGDAASLSTTAAILAKNNLNGLCDFYAPNVGRKRSASPSVSRKTSSTSRTASLLSGAALEGEEGRRRRKPVASVTAASEPEPRRAPSTTSTVPNSPMKLAYQTPPSSSPSLITKQEFEALPPAIQRKYFSTLERLRLAHRTGDELEDTTTPDSSEHFPNGSQALKRQKTKATADHVGDRLIRRSIRRSRTLSVDSNYFANLPEKARRTLLSPQEQRIAARSTAQSVMLDAADEAIYKIGKRASRVLTPDELSSLSTLSLPTSQRRASMASTPVAANQAVSLDKEPPKSFLESFRWLDEDEDLDLRLSLDDYNFHHEERKPQKARGPSFRRHLSISKIHLPRATLSPSSTRPGTNDSLPTPATPATPALPASPLSSNAPSHGRRRSRALSLMTPKASPTEPGASIGSIDAAAAHYQDPEARLKLRVYLASPQKFDEAIEFGFPSNDTTAAKPAPDLNPPKVRQPRQAPQTDDEILRTFLSDDKSSIYSEGDGASAPDPDSPKTPETMDKPSALSRHARINAEPFSMVKQSGEYAQLPASAREMTLRMTLTRPDLRAGEEQIYGWQKNVLLPARRSQSTTLREELGGPVVTYIRDGGNSKDSIERQFAAMDQWEQDQGVVKRIWNRVRRN